MKMRFTLLGVLLCLLAACTQLENEIEGLGSNKTVTVSLQTPEATLTPLTRSGEAENVALRFVAEIWKYEETSGSYSTKYLRLEQKANDGEKNTTFSFDIKDQGKYRMLLWADYIDATSVESEGMFADKYYVTNFSNTSGEYKGLKAIKVNGNNFALNTEARDAFYKTVDFDKGELQVNLQSHTLTRAVGKLVVKEKSKEVFSQSKSLSVTYDVPNTFSVETGATVGNTPYKVNVTDQSLAGNVDEEDYTLFYDYILTSAGDAGYSIAQVTLKGKDQGDVEYEKTGIPALPIKQNRRTIVSGTNMLVKPAEPGNQVSVNVDINEKWDDDITVDGDSEGSEETLAFVGDGTQESPFEISSADNLMKLMELVNGGTEIPGGTTTYAEAYYKQTADIITSSTTHKVCIGTTANPFKGTYDGSGFKLSGNDDSAVEKGLTMLSATEQIGDIAMFGVVEDATLKNIRLVANNQNKSANNTSAAGICAVAKGNTTIENSLCTVMNITCNGIAVAGICAMAESGTLTIKGCKVEQYASSGIKGNDSSNEYIGGILGYVKSGATASITDSYNTAKIAQTPDEADCMGGICGGNLGTLTVTNCYTTASFTYNEDVTAASDSKALSGYIVGGGETLTGVTITECYYAKPGGKKAQAKYTNGIAMKSDSWPSWSINDTAWKSVGNYDVDSPVYPTLDWEE